MIYLQISRLRTNHVRPFDTFVRSSFGLFGRTGRHSLTDAICGNVTSAISTYRGDNNLSGLIDRMGSIADRPENTDKERLQHRFLLATGIVMSGGGFCGALPPRY